MAQYIDKAAIVAKINSMLKSVEHTSHCDETSFNSGRWKALTSIKNSLDTLDVKESDETAEAFARIIRANLTGINEDVQYKFEQLYKEITGEKMYQGYND